MGLPRHSAISILPGRRDDTSTSTGEPAAFSRSDGPQDAINGTAAAATPTPPMAALETMAARRSRTTPARSGAADSNGAGEGAGSVADMTFLGGGFAKLARVYCNAAKSCGGVRGKIAPCRPSGTVDPPPPRHHGQHQSKERTSNKHRRIDPERVQLVPFLGAGGHRDAGLQHHRVLRHLVLHTAAAASAQVVRRRRK